MIDYKSKYLKYKKKYIKLSGGSNPSNQGCHIINPDGSITYLSEQQRQLHQQQLQQQLQLQLQLQLFHEIKQ